MTAQTANRLVEKKNEILELIQGGFAALAADAIMEVAGTFAKHGYGYKTKELWEELYAEEEREEYPTKG